MVDPKTDRNKSEDRYHDAFGEYDYTDYDDYHEYEQHQRDKQQTEDTYEQLRVRYP